MNEHELSATGEQRKREIGEMLAARARQRRAGVRALGGAGCVLLAAVAVVAVRGVMPGNPAGERVVDTRDGGPRRHEKSVETAKEENPTGARVRVVTNDPLPTRMCESGGSTSGVVSVCLMNDSQLLAALTETGQSYGLVKVGGKTRVVANTHGH